MMVAYKHVYNVCSLQSVVQRSLPTIILRYRVLCYFRVSGVYVIFVNYDIMLQSLPDVMLCSLPGFMLRSLPNVMLRSLPDVTLCSLQYIM